MKIERLRQLERYVNAFILVSCKLINLSVTYGDRMLDWEWTKSTPGLDQQAGFDIKAV